MKRFSTRLVSMFSVALLLSVATTAIGAQFRPLELKGTTSIVDGDPFSKKGATTAGTGTGTHLGNFTTTGTVTFTEGKHEEEGFIVGEGTQTFIAANGDKLFAEFRGLLDPATGNATIDFVITGGTGQFSDAEGEFVAEASTAGQGVFDFTAEGVISY